MSAMDSPTFVKRVAELSGVDKEIAERVVRATPLNLGTGIDPGEAHDICVQLPEAIGVCLRYKLEGATLSTGRIRATVACVVPLGNKQRPQAVRAVPTVLLAPQPSRQQRTTQLVRREPAPRHTGEANASRPMPRAATLCTSVSDARASATA
jgi:hypothetical protein